MWYGIGILFGIGAILFGTGRELAGALIMSAAVATTFILLFLETTGGSVWR